MSIVASVNALLNSLLMIKHNLGEVWNKSELIHKKEYTADFLGSKTTPVFLLFSLAGENNTIFRNCLSDSEKTSAHSGVKKTV